MSEMGQNAKQQWPAFHVRLGVKPGKYLAFLKPASIRFLLRVYESTS